MLDDATVSKVCDETLLVPISCHRILLDRREVFGAAWMFYTVLDVFMGICPNMITTAVSMVVPSIDTHRNIDTPIEKKKASTGLEQSTGGPTSFYMMKPKGRFCLHGSFELT